MSIIKPLIIHPMDPLGNKLGGIQTFIKNFIKYAPENFEIQFVGITTDKQARPIGKWKKITITGREIKFLPVLFVADENLKTKVPLSFKFTLALIFNLGKIEFRERILEFNRIESMMPFRLFKKNKLLVIHNNTFDLLYNPNSEVKWKNFTAIYTLYEKLMFRDVNKVFVVRQDTTEYYKKKFPAISDKFEFLPTWVDTDVFYPVKPEERKELKNTICKKNNLPSDPSLILFVGRLEGQKNPSLLIETFCQLNKLKKNTAMIIIGTGSLEDNMRALVKKYGLKEKVFFLGVKSQTDLAELLRVCDLFLLTSAFEGMPRSLLESLGSGIPSVTTDVGECRLVVIDGFSGYISKDHKAEKLAKLVLKVLENPQIFSSDNCLKTVKDYHAERVLETVYNFYRNSRV